MTAPSPASSRSSTARLVLHAGHAVELQQPPPRHAPAAVGLAEDPAALPGNTIAASPTNSSSTATRPRTPPSPASSRSSTARLVLHAGHAVELQQPPPRHAPAAVGLAGDPAALPGNTIAASPTNSSSTATRPRTPPSPAGSRSSTARLVLHAGHAVKLQQPPPRHAPAAVSLVEDPAALPGNTIAASPTNSSSTTTSSRTDPSGQPHQRAGNPAALPGTGAAGDAVQPRALAAP
ncbi:hypothetical protein [Streptomyces canus]|uniref:hypothetical protein n=1 Tax=Streptomyces canus TaxID=58343 RepID=UPI0033B8FABD